MKKILFSIALALSILPSKGQNLVFIGDNSYPSTPNIEFKPNSRWFNDPVTISIAKDGNKGLFIISTQTMTPVFVRGKLTIYLDDGTIIHCVDRGIFDYRDEVTTSVYYLTSSEIERMKNSNIHTVRYTLKCGDCLTSSENGTYTASNVTTENRYDRGVFDKTDVPYLLRKLFYTPKQTVKSNTNSFKDIVFEPSTPKFKQGYSTININGVKHSRTIGAKLRVDSDLFPEGIEIFYTSASEFVINMSLPEGVQVDGYISIYLDNGKTLRPCLEGQT